MITFHLLKTPGPRIKSAFSNTTAPRTPGKYKTSDNTTPAPPTKPDDREPGYEIPPGAAACARCVPPAEWSVQTAPGS